MAKHYNRIVLDDKAFKKFAEIEKRYRERHGIKPDVHINQSEIFLDYCYFMEGEE